MYGSIGRFVPQPGQEQALDQEAQRWLHERAPQVAGFVAAYVLIPDARPGERLALTIFDSKASYLQNAEDPAQDRWHQQVRAILAADPEWTDGEIAQLEPATVPL
jgi:hypothetical protein